MASPTRLILIMLAHGRGQQRSFQVDDEKGRTTAGSATRILCGRYVWESGKRTRPSILLTRSYSSQSGKNTESRIMDAGNLLLVSENLHRLSKKERANANAYDINEFIEPYVSSFRLHFYII